MSQMAFSQLSREIQSWSYIGNIKGGVPPPNEVIKNLMQVGRSYISDKMLRTGNVSPLWRLVASHISNVPGHVLRFLLSGQAQDKRQKYRMKRLQQAIAQRLSSAC